MLHPDFRSLLDKLAAAQAAGAPSWEELEPQDLRTYIEKIRPLLPPLAGVDTQDLRVAGGDGDIPARLYIPDGAPAMGPGLIFYHGGGFMLGSIEAYDNICRRLSLSSGMRILSVDYRLAPEHPFPAAHDDALASARWAFENAERIGFMRECIAIGGDSAGGNLAASACLDLGDDCRPCLQLLLYPQILVMELTHSRHEFADGYWLTLSAIAYFMQHLRPDAQDPRMALLRREHLESAPPAFIAIAGHDPLRDEARLYATRLRQAGISVTCREYNGFIHGFLAFAANVPEVQEAFDDAGRALQEAVRR